MTSVDQCSKAYLQRASKKELIPQILFEVYSEKYERSINIVKLRLIMSYDNKHCSQNIRWPGYLTVYFIGILRTN